LNNSYKYNADEIASNLLHAVTKLNKKNQDNTTIQIIKIPDSFGREKGSSKFLYFLLFFVSSILSITAFLIFKVFIKNSDLVETKEDTKQISPITIPNSNSAPIDPAPIAQPKLAQPEPAQNSDKSNDSGVEKNAILKNSKSKNSDKKNEIKPKGIDPKRQSPLTPPVTQGQGDLSNENKSSEERVKEKQEKLPQSTPEKVDKELPDKT
jgi:hypothetical protein